MFTDIWEVQDNNGVIHSGTEDEMRTAFDIMENGYYSYKNHSENDIKQWNCDWDGDLKLIQVHDIV